MIVPTFLKLDSWSQGAGFIPIITSNILNYIYEEKKQFYAYQNHLTQFLKMGSISFLVQFHAYHIKHLLWIKLYKTILANRIDIFINQQKNQFANEKSLINTPYIMNDDLKKGVIKWTKVLKLKISRLFWLAQLIPNFLTVI